MTKNDKLSELPKRTLSASNYLTPITNQGNVALRLGDTFGRNAYVQVWSADEDEWEDVAGYYVNLVYGDHYGTRWIDGNSDATDHTGRTNVPVPSIDSDGRKVYQSTTAVPRDRRSPSAHADYLDQVSAQHPSPTPLAGLIRFVGGEN